MKTKRVLPHYYINTKRDKQYDDALHEYLRSTWKLPGRTHTQIARGLGLGDPSKDKGYGLAIMYALQDFVENDDENICWYPNLRLKETDLQKKREKSKYNDFDLKLYKYAPRRKEIDRDPNKTDDIVKKLIFSLIEEKGPQSRNRIFESMKMKLGHIAQSVVDRCLKQLVLEKVIEADQVNPKLKVHRLL